MNQKVCIIITGPTAVGKTSVAIDVARHFNTEIISADSRQCFEELNIGVAKPTSGQLQAITHHFINSHSIKDAVNAALFEHYALEALNNLFASNDKAVVVGGTGLYIKALIEGLDEIPAVPASLREQVAAGYKEHGIEWLKQETALLDPEYYSGAEIQNPQRLMRALEVKLSTGKSIRAFQQGEKKTRDFKIINIVLDLPRDELYHNINQRVDDMMQQGLLEEVQNLLPYKNLNALQTVGYSELYAYLDKIITLPQAIDLIKKNTRHYAKRQLTWFRKMNDTNWFAPVDSNQIITFIESLV